MRTLLTVAVAALLCALAPASAIAAEAPPYDGTMSFPAIQGPDGPEEFTWEVQLNEGEDLRQIDERHAGVYFTDDDRLAMLITATAAHAADGATVPTTIVVTQPNLITLTVHHRAGNPAAGGAPFDYPIIQGEGWEGGFQTHTVEMPPPTEQVAPVVPPPPCLVPRLAGRSLPASRRILRRSHCKLGPVRGERAKGAKVVRQFRKPGTSLPAGAEVGVKLG
jgi:hypothetical protein